MFLFRFMQKCGLSSSRAYCIFAQPANSNGFVQLPIHDFNKRIFWTFLLVDLGKIQYARDDERLHFCINLNNIDNEVYCDFIAMLTSFQTISSINYMVTPWFFIKMLTPCFWPVRLWEASPSPGCLPVWQLSGGWIPLISALARTIVASAFQLMTNYGYANIIGKTKKSGFCTVSILWSHWAVFFDFANSDIMLINTSLTKMLLVW
jgi:hypothetical protein